MPNIISEEHFNSAQRLRYLYSRYQQSRDLINVGAYVAGSDLETDAAIERLPFIRKFLQQGLKESFNLAASVAELKAMLAPPKNVPQDAGANQQTRDLTIGR